jgi:hypothetical protein
MESLNTHVSAHLAYFLSEEPSCDDGPRQAIYLDTTIVSYLTARLSQRLSIARHQRITRVWWDRYRRRHTLWISKLLLDEAAAGNIFESKMYDVLIAPRLAKEVVRSRNRARRRSW